MQDIIILFGGASVEHDVSIITGLQAVDKLKDFYNIHMIYLSLDNKFYLTSKTNPKDYIMKNEIIKEGKEVTFYNGNVYLVKKKLKKILKGCPILNCCHGGVGENGTINAYFEINGFFITSANMSSSSICMNKNVTKLLVKQLDIPVVKGVCVNEQDYEEKLQEIKKWDVKEYVIKPNSLGSSIGVVKCSKKELKTHIEMALHLDKEVLIEECIVKLEELNCACFINNNELCLSEIERVGGKDILSFENKYCQTNIREIPAKIDEETRQKIYDYTKKIYSKLNLNGVVRLDFILDKESNILYLNEVNTIPGSLAFYLFEGLGIDYVMMCENLFNSKQNVKKQAYFQTDILSKTKFVSK